MLLVLITALSLRLDAQGPPPGGRGAAPPRSPREAAPVDFTGYWVSVVTEDWRWRMVTPARGDFAGVPLTPAARKLGLAWDPAKDEAAKEQCKAYGAAAIMRVPGRLHITWQDDYTLKIETDAGTQTRLLRFRAGATGHTTLVAGQLSRAVGGHRSRHRLARLSADRPQSARRHPRPLARGRDHEPATGYLRKNGVPYSARTTCASTYDLFTERNGDVWFTVTTIVEDPEYLTEPFVTSSNFKKQADATGWNPRPCTAR